MNVIYLSSSCSKKKFYSLVKNRQTNTIPQAQKYHQLLIEGLSFCKDIQLTACSALPVNRSCSKKVYYSFEEEQVDGIKYITLPFLNFPILRQACLFFTAKKYIKKICDKDSRNVIVVDVLNQSLSSAARCVGKRYKIPVVGIVTDVPGHLSGSSLKSKSILKRSFAKLIEKYAISSLEKYDAYLFLSKPMDEVVNRRNKPYIVIEGQCDNKQKYVINSLSNKTSPKVILYSGSIHVEYGIALLVNAFMKCNLSDWELHIYGDGNYRDDLIKVCNENKSIKYFGLQPNDVVVKKQIEASLLINPRPSNYDFVKYSFPSKTMEYMASGTPLLMTRLPSLPEDYFDYVYFIEDESLEGFCDALQRCCAISPTELHVFGDKAKNFILANKSNLIQGYKFCEFLKTIINSVSQ
mgnify:CR=1 FL=1